MNMPILIVGAGYVGGALAEDLVAKGHEPWILRRRAEHPRGTRLIQGDLGDAQTLTGLPRFAQAVYCAAADNSTDAAYERTYLIGLRNLLAVLAPETHVLYVSSSSVYAEDQGGWVDEEDKRLVRQGPSRFIVGAEEYLRAAAQPGTIVRFGGIYGPGRSSFLRRVAAGQETLWEGAPLYNNRIHRDDCVGILAFLLGRSELWGQIYNGVDGEAPDRNQVIAWMAQEMGVPLDKLSKTQDLRQVAHRGNKRVSNHKILASGYAFQYPNFQSGYRSILHEVPRP